MLGGVVAYVRGGVTGVRSAASAPALIEQHDAVAVWIETAAHSRRASLPRSAVHHQGRLAVRVTAGLSVHAIAIADFEHALVVGFDRRVEFDHARPNCRALPRLAV